MSSYIISIYSNRAHNRPMCMIMWDGREFTYKTRFGSATFDPRGGVQDTTGAGDVDGSTIVTRHTPTRQLQPFQRQRPTRLDLKVPPIPARLGRNRRQRCVPRDAQVPGQRDSRARHRAVLRQIEVPGSLRVGLRAAPVVRG